MIDERIQMITKLFRMIKMRVVNNEVSPSEMRHEIKNSNELTLDEKIEMTFILGQMDSQIKLVENPYEEYDNAKVITDMIFHIPMSEIYEAADEAREELNEG